MIFPRLKFEIEGQNIVADGEEVETSKPVFSDELVSPFDLKRIMAADRGALGQSRSSWRRSPHGFSGSSRRGPITQYDLINDARDAGHLPPVSDDHPNASKTALYDAVRRFSEFVAGWTVVNTTIGKRKAWELARAGSDGPSREGAPY